MSDWNKCKNILVVRLDNMGDLLMSSPAIKAIKQHLQCKITVLTSTKATGVAHLITEIDEVIAFNVPWMKLRDEAGSSEILSLITEIGDRNFDGCIIFNVYSQNPIAAIMLAYLSNIPLRLAYCRENPYALLSDWVADPEPYDCIKHQVVRDLDLVAEIGVFTSDKRISLNLNEKYRSVLETKLSSILGLQRGEFYFILHAGVSESKRRYPKELWIEIGKLLLQMYPCDVLLTGSSDESSFTKELEQGIGERCYSIAGLLSIEELAITIDKSDGIISVNTGTIHLAAAVQTPMVVLYAQTNPQHTPWMVNHVVLDYSIPINLRSKNKVIQWVNHKLYKEIKNYPSANEVIFALKTILKSEK